MPEPLDLIPPGQVLREEFMQPLGVTAYRLAKDIGVPQDRISAVLRATRAITLDTALRLGRYFGTTHQFWLNLQMDYDYRVARRSGVEDAIAEQVHPLAM